MRFLEQKLREIAELWSHHGLHDAPEPVFLLGLHLDLPAIVLAVAHGSHDLGSIIHGVAHQVDVAGFELRLLLHMLGPHDEDLADLAMSTAALIHVLHYVVVILSRGLLVHLQKLLNADDCAGRLHLHAREGQHGSLPRHLHAWSHPVNHANGAWRILWPLDRHRDAKHEHAVQLQCPFCLLDGSDLAEAVVGALVAREPYVQHRVLVGVVAEAALLHSVVELLREGILRDTEMIR
mmetsp:Transcript_57315/g.124014  ORF Transcript_57315/g.124014 Transcript_57315/m.124014 type:complete len:236 (+) Transcript_57315:118-825(+)